MRDGYTKVPNAVLLGEFKRPDGTPLPASAVQLYGVICCFASMRAQVCTASQETLARHVGVSPRQIRNLIELLESIGLVQVQRDGRGLTNTVIPLFSGERKSVAAHPRNSVATEQDNGSKTENGNKGNLGVEGART